MSELRDSFAWLFFAFALPSPCILWRVLHVTVVSSRTRTAERRGQQNACVWQTWQGYHSRVSKLNINVFWSLQKNCLKESEVWRKVISNKVIVTLVTQGLPSSFLSRPVAYTSVRATQEAGFGLSDSVGGAEKRTFFLFHPLCITYCPLLSECLGLAKSIFAALSIRRDLISPEKSNTSWKVRLSDRLKLVFARKSGFQWWSAAPSLFYFCSHLCALFLRSWTGLFTVDLQSILTQSSSAHVEESSQTRKHWGREWFTVSYFNGMIIASYPMSQGGWWQGV